MTDMVRTSETSRLGASPQAAQRHGKAAQQQEGFVSGSGRAPHLPRSLDHQAQLVALRFHGDVVAVHGAAKAALR